LTSAYLLCENPHPCNPVALSSKKAYRSSRTEAKRRFNKFDLADQTQGVECHKDSQVVDEIPAAYKDIDVVMSHQADLVEVVHTLCHVLCVKG
jgi:tRNA-splicing ligase RtcB (3'-phosphate/5'-hydroxy nucleic acid ligase)